MKTQIKLSEALGKTLIAVEFSDEYVALQTSCLLVFSDNTFTALGIRQGVIGNDPIMEGVTINILNFGDEKLAKAGIATMEELTEIREELLQRSKAEFAEIQEKRDLAEYKRLKKKYANFT